MTRSSGFGDGTTTSSATPVTALGLADAVSVSVHNAEVCALQAFGTAMCWGFNFFGQVGDGTTLDALAPVTVLNL